jgi:hypothetical protein
MPVRPDELQVRRAEPRTAHPDLGRAQWVAPLAFVLSFLAVILVIVYSIATLVIRAIPFPF